MIQVNGKPMTWVEGMKVSSMLKEKKYVFAKIVVKINGTYVPPQRYEDTIIQDGDEVQAIHMLAGG